MNRPLRVTLADDSRLFRSGLVELLKAAGLDVVDDVADVAALHASVQTQLPDVVIVDVRMPPTHTDEGIQAALQLRARFPDLGIMVLSTYAESDWVARLMASGTDRLGYLLKDRVDDVRVLVEALQRIAQGGTAIDPHVVARVISQRARVGVLDALSDRERGVLTLMAEGLSNAGIARRLYLSQKTVEARIAAIFTTLQLDHDTDANRRVQAVVTFLRLDDPS
jgi:DNA-binding NarL/FixJ family response regulator